MKKFFAFSALIAIAALASCQKQQTEAEKNAEVERQVQERLAAEHQAQQQQQLDQRQADLDAREKALAEKQNAPAAGANIAETEAVGPRAREPRTSEPRRIASGGGYSTFYTKLEPHGEWLETADYGYVWQPREAERSRSWRPYTNGRWVYTDAGWTWISEESFGWATYHYGRWTRLRGIGWVWVPGNEWAPAWVSWRKSNDYVGWAPLPPEARFDQRTGIHNWSDNYYDIGPDQYSFVASREFGAQRVEATILPTERNVTIINQTTNITNITYKNTTIVNEGPNYDELRAQSREPVQRFRLQRNVNMDVAAEPPRSVVQGETVIVSAPVIGVSVSSERPARVKQNVAQVSVDLGWEGIPDQEAAKKARAKMKSEATPPPNAPSKKFVKAAATTTATSQSSETPASSTSVPATPSPSATMAATQAPTAAATSTPRRAPSFEQSPTPAATSTPMSSAPSPLPTASQRRGRLLVPSATPTPPTTPNATPKSAASESSLTPTHTVPYPVTTPAPSASTSPAAAGVEPQGAAPGKFKSQEQDSHHRKVVPMAPPASSTSAPPTDASQPGLTPGIPKSQAQKFNPREPKPMSAASSSPTVTSTTAPNASSTSTSTGEMAPGGKLTKQERKEQKREERKELKRERMEGNQPGAAPSPSATP